jgi:hypothetical protein
MRSWDRIDIIDILMEYHKDLEAEGVRLSIQGNAGDFKKSQILDDKCVIIEQYLEEAFSIEWTGLKFVRPSASTS